MSYLLKLRSFYIIRLIFIMSGWLFLIIKLDNMFFMGVYRILSK